MFASLKKLNMVPSDLSSDEEFLRRVTIDTIGQLPSPEEVRAFLEGHEPGQAGQENRRAARHPLHAAMWATKFSDITGNDTDALENPKQLKAKRSQQWHDWLRKRFQDNMPYDEIVHGILTATSREGRTPEEWIAQVKATDSGVEGAGKFDTAATPSAIRSISSGGAIRPCRSRFGANARPPPSSACAWNAPSATSIRSTAGRRPNIAPTPTSSPA